MSRGLENFEMHACMHAKKSLNCLKENIGSNMVIKEDSVKASSGNEDQIIGNWRKGNHFL